MAVNLLRPRKRVFFSFRSEDRHRVDGLRLLAANPNYDLEIFDESVRVAIDSSNRAYIRRVIREKIARTSVTVCLLSALTHTSEWVDWELEESAEKKNAIIAMELKDERVRVIPRVLFYKGVRPYPWDPLHLGRLIQQAP